MEFLRELLNENEMSDPEVIFLAKQFLEFLGYSESLKDVNEPADLECLLRAYTTINDVRIVRFQYEAH